MGASLPHLLSHPFLFLRLRVIATLLSFWLVLCFSSIFFYEGLTFLLNLLFQISCRLRLVYLQLSLDVCINALFSLFSLLYPLSLRLEASLISE